MQKDTLEKASSRSNGKRVTAASQTRRLNSKVGGAGTGREKKGRSL